MARFPHIDSEICDDKIITPNDYLKILKNAKKLYSMYENLVIKPVVPGEVEYDFLVQEMHRYSLTRYAPRKYTQISTHPGIVANAARQVNRFFVDAPIHAKQRMGLLSELQVTIGEFESYVNRNQ